MRIRFDEKLQKELPVISKKDPKLAKLIAKQLNLFKIEPRHKSLRVHKLTGELKNLWSISINQSIRMVYLLDGDEAYFVDIGTHDEVYRR
jgi:addiction module RelE/StbE family toxin